MFAVIFKAEISNLDAQYGQMAGELRSLAMSKFGCVDFIACCEGNQEIAISYWETQEQISQWKQDATHLIAQKKGQDSWYKSYTVQVVEIIREYQHA